MSAPKTGGRAAAIALAVLVALAGVGCESDAPTTELPAGSAGDPEEATLPPPTGSTETTVQFRGVRSDSASGCTDAATNPAPGSPARLPAVDGGCYELDESDLEITSVKEAKAYEGDGGAVRLSLTLTDADAPRFDAVAREHNGARLAIVAFGQVLLAPDVMADEFDGKLSISSLSPELASRLIVALT